MTKAETKATERFKAGGTLHLDTPTYVIRPADNELFEHVLAGDFCYILTPRQMGKSSLMIRTAEQLRSQGFQTAIVDLSGLGTQATSEQWYLGIIKHLAQDLHLLVEPEQWWRERGSITPVQRFDIFLHDVALAEIAGPIVIFVDEIDSTLKLDFAGDFFAAVRYAYNLRARDSAYDRLTFVLLGVVAPTDLIKDRNRTPFNIGHPIDLREFSRADVGPLEAELEQLYPGQGRRILDRIFHWTSGHPYLTQKLCREIAEAPACQWIDAQIDRMVAALFLADEAQGEDNLQFVNSNVEASSERRQLMRLYRQVYVGEVVKEDERSAAQNRLKLIGLVQAAGGTLRMRNEIYRQAFNIAWIRQNTPTNRLQIVTWTAVAAIVLTIGTAGLYDIYQQRQASINILKQTYLKALKTDAIGVQIDQLGQLCEVAQGEAQDMFFIQMSQPQQLKLFSLTPPSKQLATVFDCLYPAIERHVQEPQDRDKLLDAMCGALKRVGGSDYDERRKRMCATGF